VTQRLVYLDKSSAQDNLHHVNVSQKQTNMEAHRLVRSSVAVPELQVAENTHMQNVKSPHFEKDEQRHLFSKHRKFHILWQLLTKLFLSISLPIYTVHIFYFLSKLYVFHI
jgi:hypothetical protein